MRCRPAGRVPLCWEIILLDSFQQLDLFSARSARAKGSGDPAPVPLILWTPYPLPAPGLRARTRDTHICIRKRNIYKQVGAPCDAPFLFAGIVRYLCRGGACPARCTQSILATVPSPLREAYTRPSRNPKEKSAQAAHSGDNSGRGQIPRPFSGRIRTRTR